MIVTLENIDQLDFAKGDGLIPVIVQDTHNARVLMVAWMNESALRVTLREGKATFWSRSRHELWQKGETSGHHLTVTELRADCDRDTLLLRAVPHGPVCHTGSATCFVDDEPVATMGGASTLEFLSELEQVIAARAADNPQVSYTARLLEDGVSRVAQKVGEEGVELALAAVGGEPSAIIGEAADLLYHLLVLLRSRQLTLAQVVQQLEQRHRTSR